ncbi:MAG: L-threonylcarbamoyladenylate synthase [Nitrosotalea sp.]
MIALCNEEGIRKASSIVKKGGTVVFPTDTVYGLGCDPRNPQAVQSVYRIKGRNESKHLPILGFSVDEISKIAFFDELSKKIADKFWPGPLTLILKIKDYEIAKSLNLTNKVAVRVPNHPCTLALLRECRILVGTSANPSGLSPSGDVKEIVDKLGGYDILLDGGKINDPIESTVVEMNENQLKILRSGKISEEELLAVV